jgi:hypothetical protein
VLGRAVGLSEFLFGSNRAALSLKVSEPLRELQHGRCFYCGGEVYLERWVRFLADHDADLQHIGTETGLLVDRATSVAVAEWSYGHAERVQAEVWLGGTDYGHLSAGWRGLLAQFP